MQVRELLAPLGRTEIGHVADALVRDRDVEPVAKRLERLVVELLLLVRDVLSLAGTAHAVALHRLGEDHGRLVLVGHRREVRVVHLAGIVPAAIQAPDVVVRHVGDHLLELGILAEEILARVGAALGLEVLVLAVDALHHQAAQQALLVAGEQRIPAIAPDDLDHVPAGAQERGFQLLDDLAVAAHGSVEPLQVAVDDEHEVVELLAHRHRDRAQRLRLIHLAVAEEAPHLAVAHRHEAAMLEVAHEACLVDGHHGPEAHRHRRELPEPRHQPRMRIGRQPPSADLLPEMLELLIGEPALEKCARVDARGGMSLDEHHVARMRLARGAPEVIEADFVQGRRRRIARDVSAVFRALAIRLHDHRHRVPADVRLEPALDRAVAGVLLLLAGRDRVDVGGVGLERQVGARTPRVVDDALEQVVRAFGAVRAQHRVDGLEPFARLGRINVVDLGCFEHQP